MPSILNATTTNGIAVSGDNSGDLAFQTNNGTTALTINTSQNVGIGTASPATKLHVAGGDLRLNNDFAINWGGTGAAIIGSNNTLLRFDVNGSERMRIDSSGNVGIGTSNPAQRLVVGSSAAKVSIGVFPFSDTTKTHLLSADNDVLRLEAIAPTNSGIFAVNTGGSERMRITSGGLVGIGTSSPTNRLGVVGGIQVTGGSSDFPTTGSGIEIVGGAVGSPNYIQAYNRTGSTWQNLNIGTATTIFETNGSERMRILNTGNILCLAGGSTTATGTGIAFPATQNASSNANTLDDYEEGTYTATMTTTSSGTITLNPNIRILKYTKVGNLVTIQGRVNITSISSPVGNVQISLPFLSSSGGPDQSDYMCFNVYTHDVDLDPSAVSLFGELNGGINVTLFQVRDNLSWTSLNAATLKGNGNEYFYMVGTYMTNT